MLPQLQNIDLGTLYQAPVAPESGTPNATPPSSYPVPLGTSIYVTKDNGRRGYTFVQFGGTSTITSGKLLVTPVAPTNSTALALPTTNTTAMLSAGSQVLYVTNGATAVTLNQFQDGQIEILGANGYSSYRIAGNSADSVGSAQLTITLNEPLRNTSALVAGTNTVNLRQSPALNPTASLTQALPVGVTIMPVANTASVTYCGWVQTYGQCFVYATSGTKGYAVCQDLSGTAGYVANNAAYTTPQVGIVQEAVGSSLASVFLTLNP